MGERSHARQARRRGVSGCFSIDAAARAVVCTRRLSEHRHARGCGRHVAALASIVAAALAAPAAAHALLVKDNLYGVKAMSGSEAWAVGNFGSIYHTTDAGKSWEARESGTKVPLFAIDF